MAHPSNEVVEKVAVAPSESNSGILQPCARRRSSISGQMRRSILPHRSGTNCPGAFLHPQRLAVDLRATRARNTNIASLSGRDGASRHTGARRSSRQQAVVRRRPALPHGPELVAGETALIPRPGIWWPTTATGKPGKAGFKTHQVRPWRIVLVARSRACGGGRLTDSRMTCGAATGANQHQRHSPHGLTYHVEEAAAPSGPFAS